MIDLDPLLIPARAPAIWLISLALLVWVVFLIAQRPHRNRLAWRLVAGTLAVLSLWALGVRPLGRITLRPAEAVLLTPGMNTQHPVLDSLMQTAPTFSLPGADTSARRGRENKVIADAGYLKRHYPEIAKLHVFGHGLREYEWTGMDSIKISAHLTPALLGISSIFWQRELYLGEKLSVQGFVGGLQNKKYLLQIIDPGGIADSLALDASQGGAFTFQLSPRAGGRVLYHLLLKSEEGDTLTHEVLDVVVRPPLPLKILTLEATIRFDTKYLKNWASRHHHAMAIRTLISRDRYREEFINLAPAPVQQLTPRLLRDFNLLVIDGKTLAALSASERQALRAAIAREGLGMLLIADEVIFEQQVFPERAFFAAFDLENFSGLDQRLLKPSWPDLDTLKSHVIPAEPFALKNSLGLKPLIYDEMARPLAAATRRGSGKIGLSLIRDSYRWVLAGRPDLYSTYWSYLFAELSRPQDRQDQWNIHEAKPILVDQPLTLSVLTQQDDPVGLIKTSTGPVDSFFLSQDFYEPSRWHGTYWPRAAGWHAIAAANGTPLSWFYAQASGQWQSWQQAQKITATLQQAARHTASSRQKLSSASSRVEPIPSFWFFLAFLLSAGFLWLERRL